MEKTFEKLSLFFDKIKTVGFWQRIFGWGQIRSLSYDAYEEFKALMQSLNSISQESDGLKSSKAVLTSDNEHLKADKAKLENTQESITKELNAVREEGSRFKAKIASQETGLKSAEKQIVELEKELALYKEKTSQMANNLKSLEKENTIFRQNETERKETYEKNAATLNDIKNKIQIDRQKEIDERHAGELRRIELLKETWSNHQDKVKEVIKGICAKHTIEYVDNVPFKGSPDNTIKLCGEFVIFDAKSPSTDDLNNFPNYIKIQTGAVKKYIKEENVRKDIFLVIPSNSVEVIEIFSYNMADYNVYIVTLDVLEPLILALKKIEEYEFVNQLSPEERENICRIIGKFAHMTKRRIQIDHFFTWEFLEILTKCQADLPKEIIDKVLEFERSEKLNPPIEKRAKQILTKTLELDNEKTKKEAEAKGITFPAMVSNNIKNLPLYEGDANNTDE